MVFEITSFVGVGDIKFGMSRNCVHDVMKWHIFKEISRYGEMSDYYQDIGFFVYYDNSQNVVAMEFHEPVNLKYNEVNLLNVSAKEGYVLMESWDESVEIDESGLTSFNLGIGFYAPNFQEENYNPVESVIVFSKDYYKI